LSHKLELGERRFLAYYATLITDYTVVYKIRGQITMSVIIINQLSTDKWCCYHLPPGPQWHICIAHRKPGSKLPLLPARPAITFTAVGRHCP